LHRKPSAFPYAIELLERNGSDTSAISRLTNLLQFPS